MTREIDDRPPKDSPSAIADKTTAELFRPSAAEMLRELRIRIYASSAAKNEPISGTLIYGSIFNSETKLVGRISNVPEVTQPVSSVEDAQKLAGAVTQSLDGALNGTLEQLSQKDAVNNAILSAGNTLDGYINHPARLRSDAVNFAQATLDYLNKPMQPDETGKSVGIMAPFFIAGSSKVLPLEQSTVDSLGLENLSASELEAMGIEKTSAYWNKLGATTEESVARKLDTYLLDPAHPIGGAKAEWFKSALGFTKENSDLLAKQIIFDEQKATVLQNTEFGTKFRQEIPIQGVNGRTIDVPFIWIKNPDDVVRMVTATDFDL